MTAGWRVTAACGLALLVIPALVTWRSHDLDGGWLLALRVAAAVAVLGLVLACWLALRHATMPPSSAKPPDGGRELLMRVTPGEQGPVTSVVPSAGPAPASRPPPDDSRVRVPAALALAAVTPVLLVIVLAVPAQPPGAAAGAPAAVATAPPSQPATSLPTQGAGTASPGTATPGNASPGTALPGAESPGTHAPTTGPPVATGSPTAGPPTTGPPATGPPATGPPATGPPTTGPPTTGPPTTASPGVEPPVAEPPDVERSTCQVTVRSGDTLWALAAAHVGDDAGDAEIDRAWRADYEANVDVVGADPDLILPGQVLTLPCG